MINSKGEVIYTNAEIAYELGLSPATINAVGRRLWGGGKIPHWTLTEAQRIVEYLKSISAEEEVRRLTSLHDMVNSVLNGKPLFENDADAKARINKDIREV